MLMYREMRRRLRPLRALSRDLQGALLQQWVERRWKPPAAPAAPHTLDLPLIVSLTSYPPRFPTLAATIKSLLMQDMRANHIVLWLTHADAQRLPYEIFTLQSPLFRIRTCDDAGPYKKLIPARLRWPNAFIATADDDVYYPPSWLRELVDGYRADRCEIPCHRAHHITLTQSGAPAPYAAWTFETHSRQASPLTFPTGIGGVLYPPDSLHPSATNAALFTKLAPTADDAWVYMMARRQGWSFRRISRRRFVAWPGTQAVALQHENVAGANDAQLARLIGAFGFPPVIARDMPAPRFAAASHAW